eukprot:PhF_6_TR28255/c0_g1_i1/m.41780
MRRGNPSSDPQQRFSLPKRPREDTPLAHQVRPSNGTNGVPPPFSRSKTAGTTSDVFTFPNPRLPQQSTATTDAEVAHLTPYQQSKIVYECFSALLLSPRSLHKKREGLSASATTGWGVGLFDGFGLKETRAGFSEEITTAQ